MHNSLHNCTIWLAIQKRIFVFEYSNNNVPQRYTRISKIFSDMNNICKLESNIFE